MRLERTSRIEEARKAASRRGDNKEGRQTGRQARGRQHAEEGGARRHDGVQNSLFNGFSGLLTTVSSFELFHFGLV